MRFMQFHWLVTWCKTTGLRFLQLRWPVTWCKTTDLRFMPLHRFMPLRWLGTWCKTAIRLRFMPFSVLVSGGTLVVAVLAGVCAFQGSSATLWLFPIASLGGLGGLLGKAVWCLRRREPDFNTMVGSETIQAFGNFSLILALVISGVGIMSTVTRLGFDIDRWETGSHLAIMLGPVLEGFLSVALSTLFSISVRHMGVLTSGGARGPYDDLLDDPASGARPPRSELPDTGGIHEALTHLKTAIMSAKDQYNTSSVKTALGTLETAINTTADGYGTMGKRTQELNTQLTEVTTRLKALGRLGELPDTSGIHKALTHLETAITSAKDQYNTSSAKTALGTLETAIEKAATQYNLSHVETATRKLETAINTAASGYETMGRRTQEMNTHLTEVTARLKEVTTLLKGVGSLLESVQKFIP